MVSFSLSPYLDDEETHEKKVAMLQPFTRKDLMIRSLPDRLYDYENMKYLYPGKPKDQAFGKFYSQQVENPPIVNARTGYVPHHLVNVIQRYFECCSSYSFLSLC